jgi:DNA polymerase-3 subunit epsilon
MQILFLFVSEEQMVNQVLIIDTETTALEQDKGQVIEVGAIFYSVKHQTTIQQISFLLPAEDNPAECINCIKPTPLAELVPEDVQMGLSMLDDMARKAEVVVAHNADFDSKWFGCERNGKVVLPPLVNLNKEPLPWVCTCQDFKWPRQTRPGQSLVDLALAHGIGVATAHRALTDCQLIAALFDRMDNLQAMFARALRPKAHFIAQVFYEDRELAKQAGFKWFSQTRTWERTMAVEDTQALPFQVRQVLLASCPAMLKASA